MVSKTVFFGIKTLKLQFLYHSPVFTYVVYFSWLMDESMESGLQFWRMRRAVLAGSTRQTKQQFDEIFAEIKLPLTKNCM